MNITHYSVMVTLMPHKSRISEQVQSPPHKQLIMFLAIAIRDTQHYYSTKVKSQNNNMQF